MYNTCPPQFLLRTEAISTVRGEAAHSPSRHVADVAPPAPERPPLPLHDASDTPPPFAGGPRLSTWHVAALPRVPRPISPLPCPLALRARLSAIRAWFCPISFLPLPTFAHLFPPSAVAFGARFPLLSYQSFLGEMTLSACMETMQRHATREGVDSHGRRKLRSHSYKNRHR